jgi:hypothetical protein
MEKVQPLVAQMVEPKSGYWGTHFGGSIETNFSKNRQIFCSKFAPLELEITEFSCLCASIQLFDFY